MDCLVTKLKASVNNPSLPLFDTWNFSINGISGYTVKLGRSSNGDCRFTAGSLYDDELIPVADEALGAPGFSIESVVNCKLSNMSELRMININGHIDNFDISVLLDCPKIVFICLAQEREQNCSGDIKQFIDKFASLYPNREETLKITASNTRDNHCFTNIPTGVGATWDTMGEIFFDSSYTNGWYIKASDGTYYDSEGNVITP